MTIYEVLEGFVGPAQTATQQDTLYASSCAIAIIIFLVVAELFLFGADLLSFRK